MGTVIVLCLVGIELSMLVYPIVKSRRGIGPKRVISTMKAEDINYGQTE